MGKTRDVTCWGSEAEEEVFFLLQGKRPRRALRWAPEFRAGGRT
jgi:hypothetical protein